MRNITGIISACRAFSKALVSAIIDKQSTEPSSPPLTSQARKAQAFDTKRVINARHACRVRNARAGGRARARSAARDEHGRFLRV